MKIEVGKYYRTRGGEKVGPMMLSGSWGHGYAFAPSPSSSLWDDMGNALGALGTSNLDLISEWVDAAPEVGTLQEIGAQVGDVVQYIGDPLQPGDRRTIKAMTTPYWTSADDEQMGQDSPYWRIISRANQGPVREVTTVRKEIVPGVYGHIWVEDVDGDVVKLGMRNNALNKLDSVGLSRAELTAVIRTLTAIRNAIADSSVDV